MAEMQRRDFLKKAGTGAIAVASLPAWVSAVSRVASADENEKGWHFVVVSHAGTKDFAAIVGAGEVESVQGPAPLQGEPRAGRDF